MKYPLAAKPSKDLGAMWIIFSKIKVNENNCISLQFSISFIEHVDGVEEELTIQLKQVTFKSPMTVKGVHRGSLIWLMICKTTQGAVMLQQMLDMGIDVSSLSSVEKRKLTDNLGIDIGVGVDIYSMNTGTLSVDYTAATTRTTNEYDSDG